MARKKSEQPDQRVTLEAGVYAVADETTGGVVLTKEATDASPSQRIELASSSVVALVAFIERKRRRTWRPREREQITAIYLARTHQNRDGSRAKPPMRKRISGDPWSTDPHAPNPILPAERGPWKDRLYVRDVVLEPAPLENPKDALEAVAGFFRSTPRAVAEQIRKYKREHGLSFRIPSNRHL